MEEANIPYRCAIYWKVDAGDVLPQVTVYGLNDLIRLNRTASLIWLLSDGHHSERQIVQSLKEKFPGVSARKLWVEMRRFLTHAESRGLLMRHWDPLQPYRMIQQRLM